MKLSRLSSLLLGVSFFSIAFLSSLSKIVAAEPVSVVHETENGKTITLHVGETAQFVLAENIPNTTPWNSVISWWSVDQTISLTEAVPIYSEAKDSHSLAATMFTCFAQKTGQSVIYFYKNGLVASRLNPTWKVSDNVIQNPIIFVVNVIKPVTE